MNEYLLSMHLPKEIVSKIVYDLLSYGTPSSRLIRDYISQNMHKLPVQYNEDFATLWRYQVYSSHYKLLRINEYTIGRIDYHPVVRYEIILILIKSHDCLVALRSKIVLESMEKLALMTLKKLFAIHVHALSKLSSEERGTPSSLLIKKHFKDVRRKEFHEDFINVS